MPGTVGALTANAEGDLYAACGVDIYRVRFRKITRTPLFHSRMRETGRKKEIKPMKESCPTP